MRPIHTALLLVATFPATGVSQTPPAPAPTPARPPVAAPAYRGFTPGISYREFLERARPLADSDMVRCQTSPHTAQVMACGVVIRGPEDAATREALGSRRKGLALGPWMVRAPRAHPPGAGPRWSGGGGGRRASPSRAPRGAPARAGWVPVSPPASARKMGASARDGRGI